MDYKLSMGKASAVPQRATSDVGFSPCPFAQGLKPSFDSVVFGTTEVVP